MLRRFLMDRLSKRQRRMLARAAMTHAQFLFAVVLLQAVVTDGKIRGVAAIAATLLWMAWIGSSLWLEGLDRDEEV